MTIEQDPRTRVVLSWLREDAHENPERMLLRALDEVDATPQRRSWWPAWRSSHMNTYAKLIVAAAAVVVVAVVGSRFLPGNGGVGGATPSPMPSPSPALLAKGTFHTKGIAVDIDATGAGSDVTGVMTWDFGDARVAVDLQCTRTTPGGLIVIGGTVTDSTYADAPKGSLASIVLRRGTPVSAHPHTDGRPPAASCMAFVDGVDDAGGAVDLEPITGNDHIDFGP